MSTIDFKQGLALFELALTCSILIIYLAQYALRVDFTLKKRALACVILLPLLLFPMHYIAIPWELPLIAYVRGVTGDLSVVTLLLLWSAFFMQMPTHTPILLKSGVVVAGLLFYPLALGLGMIDPYSWGYGSVFFLSFIWVIILGMWWAKWNRETVIFSFAIMAWALGLHESRNLWDYILDPFLFLWCLVSLIYASCIAYARNCKST